MHKRRFLLKRFFTRGKLIGLGVSFLLFVFAAASNTMVGNAMQLLLIFVWTQLVSSIKANPLVWLIVGAITIGSFSIIVYLWIKNINLEDALATTKKVVLLDDLLLLLLIDSVANSKLEQEKDLILEKLLQGAVRMLPSNIYRGAIFLPDELDPEHLTMRVNYNMSDTSVKTAKFYIGPDSKNDDKRGTVGNVFRDKEKNVRVGHITISDSGWDCDQKDFIKFDKNRPHPAYYAFINVPIIRTSNNADVCLGVLGIDSDNPSVFDVSETQKLLIDFGRKVATTLTIYEQLISSRKT